MGIVWEAYHKVPGITLDPPLLRTAEVDSLFARRKDFGSEVPGSSETEVVETKVWKGVEATGPFLRKLGGCNSNIFYFHPYMEPQTTNLKLMFGETTISYIKVWNHPIETTIYKWLFGVPGTWGNDPIWRAYFSTGLKPPTRKELAE